MCKHDNRMWLFELADQKFEYCFLSGKFRYRACSLNRKHLWGEVAGGGNGAGYVLLAVTVEGKQFKLYAHRLVIYLATGEMPPEVVNHIDGNKSNNRLINLENETPRGNTTKGKTSRLNKDNSSKYVGVGWDKSRSKWQSRIEVGGKGRWLGYFKSEKAAAAAYQKALKELTNE